MLRYVLFSPLPVVNYYGIKLQTFVLFALNTYFLLSFIVLATLLFFPVSKLIWAISISRLQKKTSSELPQYELDAQLKRARILAIFVVLIFSYLFNISIGLRP